MNFTIGDNFMNKNEEFSLESIEIPNETDISHDNTLDSIRETRNMIGKMSDNLKKLVEYSAKLYETVSPKIDAGISFLGEAFTSRSKNMYIRAIDAINKREEEDDDDTTEVVVVNECIDNFLTTHKNEPYFSDDFIKTLYDCSRFVSLISSIASTENINQLFSDAVIEFANNTVTVDCLDKINFLIDNLESSKYSDILTSNELCKELLKSMNGEVSKLDFKNYTDTNDLKETLYKFYNGTIEKAVSTLNEIVKNSYFLLETVIKMKDSFIDKLDLTPIKEINPKFAITVCKITRFYAEMCSLSESYSAVVIKVFDNISTVYAFCKTTFPTKTTVIV